MRPLGRHRSPRALLAAASALLVLALAAGPAQARDDTVTSFDGTKIAISFFPAAGLQPGKRAPTVLLGHGWGQSRQTDENGASDPDLFGQVGVGPLRQAGFNVLTWDARGWGQSTGTITVDWAGAEGRDVQALIDYAARQPEALLDRAGDPRVGMSGVSYAGGIQLVTAGIDRRVDAITPTIAWNSLVSSLDKDGAPKGGWSSILVGAAAGHNKDPHIDHAFQASLTTGAVPPEDQQWFASRGPGSLVSKIRIPTLLVEGTADTLFTLHEAIVNYGILKGNGVPLKMLWFCGGHGACTSAHDPSGLVEREVIAWLRRYLAQDRTVSTGPAFEWVSDDGELLHAGSYPPPARPALVAEGSGPLAITPGDNGAGTPISAAPAADALNVSFAAPPAGAQYAGEPTLTMTYSGTALPAAQTHVFAQIVNLGTGQVLGNQSTPIPVTLDGLSHSITRKLEGVATTGVAGTTYTLQLTGGSSLYLSQRGAGVLNVSRLRASMPGVQPAP